VFARDKILALDSQTVKIAKSLKPLGKKGRYLKKFYYSTQAKPVFQENRYRLYNKIYIFFKSSGIWRKQKTMTNTGNLGLTTGILLIVILFISAVAGSVIIQSTDNTSNPDLTKITNEALDEITTYLQIKNVVGKYENIQGQEGIRQIAIFIKPLVSSNIDITKLTLMISNGNDLRFLSFSGQVAPIRSYSLFSHPLWDSMDEGSYSIISTVDDDTSMTDVHLINKNTDMGFIIFTLPATDPLLYDGSMQVTLIPSPGNECSVTLEPPLPTTHVVSLYG
jgi:archaellin